MGAPVLGIESSCDETAAAVVDASGLVISSVVSSQIFIHHEYGGVVPELASREHILNIVPVVREALLRAELVPRQLAGIAITSSPGLVGALLVGLQFGKALAWASGRPLVGVDHLHAHLEAVYVRNPADPPVRVPRFPHVILLVSGGHTLLGIRRDEVRLELLGATRDDAAGEAYDKVAKMLGLGYPGGKIIDELASRGRPESFKLPRAMRGRATWDFSFSGLKTAVRLILERQGLPSSAEGLADLCASFQQAVVEVLVERVEQAVRHTGLGEVVVAGGVAANSGLRRALVLASERSSFRLYVPALEFCTDNAAMVAMAGLRRLGRGESDDLGLNATANWQRPSP
ncbi:MAG: tRNA (adenosine(37)-N6)-threonylcarbamoyltransferase complex transferase subunit TsaD [Polyangia bacterium]|nr:tRNA (adenosine(37)-N6)-threonylcarbamoyltransferase complex transferase subunit TsaD [Polyangia bacterium]